LLVVPPLPCSSSLPMTQWPNGLCLHATRICLHPSTHNFHRHVTKRPLRWLDAWRRTLKSSPLHVSSHLNALLSMVLFISADATPQF
jgi:hypothetical protein